MTFWDLFTHWWQITFHQHIVLSEKVILYGWHHNRSLINSIALNYSLIIAKYHIFASSIRVGSLDFDGFLLRYICYVVMNVNNMYTTIVNNISDVNNVSIVGNVSIVKYLDLPIIIIIIIIIIKKERVKLKLFEY